MKGTARFRTKRREPDSDFNITSPCVLVQLFFESSVVGGPSANQRTLCPGVSRISTVAAVLERERLPRHAAQPWNLCRVTVKGVTI